MPKRAGIGRVWSGICPYIPDMVSNDKCACHLPCKSLHMGTRAYSRRQFEHCKGRKPGCHIDIGRGGRRRGGSMRGPSEMEETEAAILRFTATLRSPGCIHIVLESISPKSPYMLENRSAFGCQYREAGLQQVPQQLLPPWSAAAFAWQTTQRNQQEPAKVRRPAHALWGLLQSCMRGCEC